MPWVSMSHTDSSHIALMMANAAAKPTPSSQLKYHMVVSLIKCIGVLQNGLFGDVAPDDFVNPAGVQQYNGQKHHGDPERPLQGGVAEARIGFADQQ